MRTTIRLDAELLSRVRQVAAKTNRSLSTVMGDALRQYLAQEQTVSEREAVRLTTVDGKGTLPGVDLDDSAALLDLETALPTVED